MVVVTASSMIRKGRVRAYIILSGCYCWIFRPVHCGSAVSQEARDLLGSYYYVIGDSAGSLPSTAGIRARTHLPKQKTDLPTLALRAQGPGLNRGIPVRVSGDGGIWIRVLGLVLPASLRKG